MTLVPGVLEWVVSAIGSGAQVLSVDELPPSSTEKHVVALGTRHGVVRAVTRRYHDRERLENDFAYAPGNEAAALALLGPTDVPAPRLYAADLEGTVSGAPLLLESWVPGEAAWGVAGEEEYLRAAAEVLVKVHAFRLPTTTSVMAYRPYRESSNTSVLGQGSTWPEMWASVSDALENAPPGSESCFIHRDYHPGNVLWDGKAIHVVDWATTATGPAGIDLARMRQNLASMCGVNVADRFTTLYVEAGGDPVARHPYWDLLDAADLWLDRDVEAPGEGDLVRFEDYVASVVTELG